MSNFVGLDFLSTRKELGVTGREFQGLKRDTFAAMGKEWHFRYLTLHFGADAPARYGYMKRKGENLSGKARRRSYVGRKERQFKVVDGAAMPLEFSGEGFRLAALLDLRVNSKQARVVLPRKFNLRNPKSRIDMRAELTKVLQPEADEITQVGATAFGRSLDAVYRFKQ